MSAAVFLNAIIGDKPRVCLGVDRSRLAVHIGLDAVIYLDPEVARTLAEDILAALSEKADDGPVVA